MLVFSFWCGLAYSGEVKLYVSEKSWFSCRVFYFITLRPCTITAPSLSPASFPFISTRLAPSRSICSALSRVTTFPSLLLRPGWRGRPEEGREENFAFVEVRAIWSS